MTREGYQHNVWVYKKRRIKLRGEYEKWKKDKDYSKRCFNLTRKIVTWNAAIKRIDTRKIKIRRLVKAVDEYFDLKIESRERDSKHNLARNIYYKIGLESNLRGVWLARYIGRSRKMAFRGRERLNKNFKKEEQSKGVFYKFKEYLKNAGY